MKKMYLSAMLIGGAVLAGCAESSHGTQDAPVQPGNNIHEIAPNRGLVGQNNEPANVINMPNGFMNIAFKCNGVDGIYAHTRSAAPVIVPNDPQCSSTAPVAK